MLRGNLSSRPFYNERLVSLVLLLVAVAALALTAFNASRLAALSAMRAELDGQIERDLGEAARIEAEATRIQAAFDVEAVREMAASTAEANVLIAERTFSWTGFFGIVEGILPYDVRLVGVAHRFEAGQRMLVLNVIAKQDSDINELVRGMLDSGRFYDVLPIEKTRNEDGTLGAVLETYYLPSSPGSGATEPPAASGGRP
jgi:hypothetical protein